MDRIIIPIASGKGGVGKSFMAANIAIALAGLGKKVIAADLDFGGSNLHTCFGMHNTHPGIGDYLRAKYGKLEDLLVNTNTDNLQFLAGDALVNQRTVYALLFRYNVQRTKYNLLP